MSPTYTIPVLPPAVDLETVPVLKALAAANRALAELKGRAATIPNQGILIDTMAPLETKASSPAPKFQNLTLPDRVTRTPSPSWTSLTASGPSSTENSSQISCISSSAVLS